MLKIKLAAILLLLTASFTWAEVVEPKSDGAVQGAAQEAVEVSAININQANAVELAGLANIGPKKARQIVAYRETHGEFSSIDDLRKVKGIGQATVDKNRVRMMVAAE